MNDVLIADAQTQLHEASHAVVAVVLGRRLVRVIGDRHHADDGERGSVEWIGNDADPLGEATILLAGRIGAEGVHPPGDTTDERQARKVCPLGISRARADAWAILQRRDVRDAMTALCHVLEARPVLLGIDAEEIITTHLRA